MHDVHQIGDCKIRDDDESQGCGPANELIAIHHMHTGHSPEGTLAGCRRRQYEGKRIVWWTRRTCLHPHVRHIILMRNLLHRFDVTARAVLPRQAGKHDTLIPYKACGDLGDHEESIVTYCQNFSDLDDFISYIQRGVELTSLGHFNSRTTYLYYPRQFRQKAGEMGAAIYPGKLDRPGEVIDELGISCTTETVDAMGEHSNPTGMLASLAPVGQLTTRQPGYTTYTANFVVRTPAIDFRRHLTQGNPAICRPRRTPAIRKRVELATKGDGDQTAACVRSRDESDDANVIGITVVQAIYRTRRKVEEWSHIPSRMVRTPLEKVPGLSMPEAEIRRGSAKTCHMFMHIIAKGDRNEEQPQTKSALIKSISYDIIVTATTKEGTRSDQLANVGAKVFERDAVGGMKGPGRLGSTGSHY
ncbi:hypothetical protein V8E55_002542 [Tylopilus felleus]